MSSVVCDYSGANFLGPCPDTSFQTEGGFAPRIKLCFSVPGKPPPERPGVPGTPPEDPWGPPRDAREARASRGAARTRNQTNAAIPGGTQMAGNTNIVQPIARSPGRPGKTDTQPRIPGTHLKNPRRGPHGRKHQYTAADRGVPGAPDCEPRGRRETSHRPRWQQTSIYCSGLRGPRGARGLRPVEMCLECRRQRPRPARGDCGPGSEHPTSLLC